MTKPLHPRVLRLALPGALVVALVMLLDCRNEVVFQPHGSGGATTPGSGGASDLGGTGGQDPGTGGMIVVDQTGGASSSGGGMGTGGEVATGGAGSGGAAGMGSGGRGTGGMVGTGGRGTGGSGTGGAGSCMLESQCRGNLHCTTPPGSTTPGTCVQCVNSGQCTVAPNLVCDTNLRRCVECTGSGNCGGRSCINSRCQLLCTLDAQCPAGKCEENTFCGCSSAEDCPGMFCLTSACVGCLNDASCTGAVAHVCDPARKTCVECVAHSTCPSAKPFCNVNTGTCI